MVKSEKLERVRKLVHMQGDHSVPSAHKFMPEIRSDLKWGLNVGRNQDTARFRQLLIIWQYGVAFAEIEDFHSFLKTNEPLIFSSCGKLMKNVAYRGTYLNTEGGTPMYQTIWAYDSLNGLKQWDRALQSKRSKNFYNAIKTLRSYWARDPGRSEHRYRLASLYTNLKSLANADPFLAVTLAGVSKRRK